MRVRFSSKKSGWPASTRKLSKSRPASSPPGHGVEDGPEPDGSVDVEGGRADVAVPRRVLAGFVAAAHRVVEARVVRGAGEGGGESRLRERLGDHGVEVLGLPPVDTGAHGGVEVPQDVLAVRLCGGDRDTHRPDGAVDQVAVPAGEFVPVVVQIQAHRVEADVDRAQSLHLQHPA